MRTTSTTLANIVTSTHNATTRARLVTGFPQSTNPLTGIGSAIPVVGGKVDMDSTAEIRSTLDMRVRVPWLTVIPDGTELLVEQGVEISGGSFEWVSLGFYRIDEVSQRGWDAELLVTGSDRMAQVRDTENVFATNSIPKTTTHADFYKGLLYGLPSSTWMHPQAGVFPSTTVDQTVVFDYADSATRTIGYQQPLAEGTYYDIMKKLADRTGKRLFFDYLGRLNVVSDIVQPASVPHLIVAAGPGGQLSDIKRQITRRGVYTSTRVQGTQQTEGDPPWSWTASGGSIITPNPAPDAPAWEGKFGRIVKPYSSPLLTTTAECLAAGMTVMAKVKGLPTSLAFDMTPHPGLETLDTVQVVWPENPASTTGSVANTSTSNQTSEIHVVDRLSFPLGGKGKLSVTTRDRFYKVA